MFPSHGRFDGGPIQQPITRDGTILERSAGGYPRIDFGSSVLTLYPDGSSGYVRAIAHKGMQIRGSFTGATPPIVKPVLLLANEAPVAADRQWMMLGFGTDPLKAELHADPNSLLSGTNHPSVVLSARGSIVVQAMKEIGGTLKLAFFGGTPAAKPDVTGSKAANAALTSLLSALADLGLVTDSTT